MSRNFILVLILVFFAIALKAQTPRKTGREFTINVPASKVEFSVGSSAGGVNGVFQSWSCKLRQDMPGVPESAKLSLEVAAATISTGSGVSDKMVKGTDFFDTEKFATVTFTSTKVIPSNDPNKFQAQGDFTLRGVTKPAALQVNLDPDNKGGGQIYADLSFDRRDFGMTKNLPLTGVNDSIRVRLDLHVSPDPDATEKSYSWSKVVRIKVDR